MAVLLLESGDTVLLEDNFSLLLESVVVIVSGGSLCLSVDGPTCTLTVSEDC